MIEIVQGDITQMDVDAIVNAANQSLCGGGGVDGAIHRAAGPELLALCRTLGGCKTGHAKITPGFNLKAKHIIHAVGPVWYGGHKNEAQDLASCYHSVISLAKEHKIQSIAFPAISCGAYRFPLSQAAKIALDTVTKEIQDTQIEVSIVCFEAAVLKAFSQAVAKA